MKGLSGFSRLIVERPWTLACILWAVTLLAVWKIPDLRFEPDVSRLLPQDNPVIQLGRGLQGIRPTSRTLLVEVGSDKIAEKLPELAERLRQSPYVEEVAATRAEFAGSSDGFKQAPLYYMPPDLLTRLEDRLTGEGRWSALEDSQELLADDPVAGAEIVQSDPLGLRWLMEEAVLESLPLQLEPGSEYVVLAGGERGVIRVKGHRVPYDLPFTKKLLNDLQERLSDVDVRLHGAYTQAAADSERVREDLTSSSLTSLIFVCIFLALSMRRLLDPILVFIPVLLAISWALPLGGAILGPLTALTVSSAAILVGLGVDFTIHYLVRYRSESQHHTYGEAVKATLEAVGPALVAGMLTTVAAFLSLALADFRGLRMFGLLLAIGLTLAFFCAVTVLPLLLRFRGKFRATAPTCWIPRAFDRVAESRAGFPLTVLLFVTACVGCFFAAQRGVDFSSQIDSFRPQDDAVALAASRFEQEVGFSLMPVAILLDEDSDRAAVAGGIEKLREEGRIGFSEGVHLAYPTDARKQSVASFRERTKGWLDGTRHDLESLGFDPEPFDESLNRYQSMFTGEPDPAAHELQLPAAGQMYDVALCYPRSSLLSREEWQDFLTSLENAVGEPVQAFHVQSVLEEIRHMVIRDLVRSATTTGIVCVILVLIFAGGIRAGILALLPCLFGFGVTLGALAFFGISLNMANCVAIPFLLGIGVDHGVHLVSHFRKNGGCRTGSCGVAIWRSSITTILGFGSLITAQTPGIASMGLISILGVVTCLLTSLIVFPVLWRLWIRSS